MATTCWVENGTIKLDTTLEELKIDDIGGLLPIEKKGTNRDVITARSGVNHPAPAPATISPRRRRAR
jgi:hypothetical protein